LADPVFYELAARAKQMEMEGRRVIRLNVGDTNLPTPPCAVEAAVTYLQARKAGYEPAQGMPALLEAIARREGCLPENVVAGPGSKHLIAALISTLTQPGDGVIILSPHWPAYGMICGEFGRVPLFVKSRPESGWLPDAIPYGKGKAIILCNPLNPVSIVYPPAFVEEVINEAARHGVAVVIDEAYRGLAFQEYPRYDGAIRVRSFSKEFNMEGWRLGYVASPAPVARRLTRFNQITATCVAPFVQAAGIACLQKEKELLSENLKNWKERTSAAVNMLSGTGMSFTVPTAGIYLFATHSNITNGDRFVLELLEKGVALAPGSCFGDYGNYVRICLNQDVPLMREALDIMHQHLQ
jgi:aspartate aminotransferase